MNKKFIVTWESGDHEETRDFETLEEAEIYVEDLKEAFPEVETVLDEVRI